MAKRTSLLTGQAIMRAGERDPVRRAALHDRRLRVRQEELWHSRCGNGKEEAWFELQQVVETYDFYGPPIRRMRSAPAAVPAGQARKRDVPGKVVQRRITEPPSTLERDKKSEATPARLEKVCGRCRRLGVEPLAWNLSRNMTQEVKAKTSSRLAKIIDQNQIVHLLIQTRKK